jgi:hypothetical protein
VEHLSSRCSLIRGDNLTPLTEPSLVPRSLRVTLRHSSRLTAQSVELRDSLASGREVPERDDLVCDKPISICVDHVWRADLRGLSAGCPGFGRHDRNRKHELRSLADNKHASIGGDRVDSRFLDGTKLRCRGEWPNSTVYQYVVDSG